MIAALAVLLSASPATLTKAEMRTCLGTTRVAMNWEKAGQEKAQLPEAAWQDACRQARDANERRLSAARVIRTTGASPVGGYRSALTFVTLGRAASDPDVADLFRYVADDQLARESLSRTKTQLAQGLSPMARRLFDGLVSQDAVDADLRNRTWLWATVKRRGWFTIDRDGKEADRAAQLIVQHADEDLSFKREMLDVLEPLVANGQSSKNFFPYIHDRWAAAAKAPQRFGLQGECKSPGVWEPFPIEDAEHVDERRWAFGIKQPLGEQKLISSKQCP